MTRLLLSFSAWSTGISGGDRHLLESAQHWRESVDLEVVAPPNALPIVRGYLEDVPVRTIGTTSTGLALGGALLAGEYVRRAVVAETRAPVTDIAVASSHFLPDAAIVHAAGRRGARTVGFVYHLIAARRDRSLRTTWSRLDEAIGLRLLRRSNATIFVSNVETDRALRARGIAPIHTDVGLQLASFTRAEPERAEPLVLFIARLVPKKGLLDLLRAWPKVLAQVPHARLVVGGTGPERETAERLAARLGVDASVEWRGFVTEDEKRELLSSACVFAAPSHEEGWGISVAEAMASALPVVAYGLETLDEVFGDAYVPVDVGAIDSLADELAGLLLDRQRAAQIGRRGAERVARYDISAIADAELDAILRAGHPR